MALTREEKEKKMLVLNFRLTQIGKTIKVWSSISPGHAKMVVWKQKFVVIWNIHVNKIYEHSTGCNCPEIGEIGKP